jgi:hypothetical protein
LGSIGAIEALTDSAESNLSSHGATAGAPDLPDTGIIVTTSSTTPTTAPPATPPPSPPVTASTTFTSVSEGLSNGGNRWNPSVTVRATNSSDGSVLIGVTIELTWVTSNGQITVRTCATTSTGVCSFQLSDLGNRPSNSNPPFVDSVTATITAVTGTNPPVTYTPGPGVVINPVNN